MVEDELVRELRDRDDEDEVEEELEVGRVPLLSVERAEMGRAEEPQELRIALEDGHGGIMPSACGVSPVRGWGTFRPGR